MTNQMTPVAPEGEALPVRAERALPWAAEPEDIARTVWWLATDDSRCITGQTIAVDCGLTARRPRDMMREWAQVQRGEG